MVSLYGERDPRDIPNYTVAEAATLLTLAPTTLRQWVAGRSYTVSGDTPSGEQRRSDSIIAAGRVRGRLMLSFNNLVEAHVLAAMRIQHGVPLARVREALAAVHKLLGGARPLLERRFETDGANLFVEHLGNLMAVSGRHVGQIGWRDTFGGYLKRVDRDPLGLPCKLHPWLFHNDQSNDMNNDIDRRMLVTVDPCISFGRAVFTGTAVPVFAVVDRVRRGESLTNVADDYGLSVDSVALVVMWLAHARAA